MSKRKEKLSQRISKMAVEMFCVIMVCSMVLGAVNVLVGNNVINNVTVEQNTYIVHGYVEHPYVNRTIKNATIVFWNLRTEEGNITNTDDNGYYSINLDEYGISHESGDEIRLLTYYMHYTNNQTITVDGNSSHEVDVKLKNNNHFNNYNIPELNLTIPEFNETFEDYYNMTEYNFTEPEFPEFNYTGYNFTEPELPDFENYSGHENSSKQLPNLTVSDISYGELAVGNETQLNITIGNINNATAYSVVANIIYENDNNNSLGNLTYGNIAPNETKTNSILWTPVKSDVNNLKITIYTGNQKENTMIIGFYVRNKSTSNSTHSSGTGCWPPTPPPNNWEITQDTVVWDEPYIEIKNRNIIVKSGYTLTFEKNVYLELTGDFVIEPGATLTFKKNVELVMMAPEIPGDIYEIIVDADARFNVWGEKGAESQISAYDYNAPYNFNVQGSLSIRNSRILHTRADSLTDASQPSGIRLFEGSTCNIEDAEIRDGQTNNIYCEKSSVTIRDSKILRAGSIGGMNTGHGVYLTEASLYLDDTLIKNEEYGEHGIYAYKSGVYITGSEITENDYGVYLYEADPDVKIITDYLGDGSSEKTVEFTTGGGSDVSSSLLIPEGAIVTSAKLKLTGVGGLDQSQDAAGSYWDVPVDKKFGQSFTPRFSILSYIDVYMRRESEEETKMDIYIGETKEGTPLTAVTTTVGMTYGWYRFDFLDVEVIPGQLYTFMVYDPDQTGSTLWFYNQSGNQYPGGREYWGKYDEWYDDWDVAFRTYSPYPTNPTLSVGTDEGIDSGWHPIALSFDGEDDYIDCGNKACLDITDEITIEAWIKTSSIITGTEEGMIVAKHKSGYTKGYFIEQFSDNTFAFYLGLTTGPVRLTTSSIINDNLWHHVAGVFDGTTMYAYVDGEEVGRQEGVSGTIKKTDASVKIGAIKNGTMMHFFDGIIDEVRILNTALELDEIQEDYRLGRYQWREGTMAWYHFDEGSGDTIYDSSGNENTGTRYGATWYGIFDRWETVDFREELNQYLEAGEYNVLDGNIIVPLKLTSDTAGKIKISDIKVEWEKDTTIVGNTITYNDRGVQFTSSDDVNIDDCNIAHNTLGTCFDSSPNNTITNCNVYSNDYYGITLSYSSNNNTVTNSVVYNNSRGIKLYKSSNNQIINCDVYNNNYHYGIWLEDSSNNNTVTNCSIYNNYYYGIYLYYSSNNQITNCEAYNNNFYGIMLDSSSNNNQITNCDVYNNSDGIMLYSSSNNNQITNCDVYNNSDGIMLYSSSNNNQITNCDVYSNEEKGIYICDDSNDNTVSDCGVYSNDYGVVFQSSSSENEITDCNIWDNTCGISITDSSENNQVVNCNVYENGDAEDGGWGLRVDGSSGNIVTNCYVYNNYDEGIYLDYSSDNTITNCAVYNNSGYYYGYGIVLSDSSNNQITNCNAYNNSGYYSGYGILLSDSSNNQITNSNAYNNDYGIHLRYSSNNNQIINCNAYSNSYEGIRLSSSNNNQITNYNAYNNYNGILLSSSSNNNITNCNVYNNRDGIYMSSSSNNQITNCGVYNNNYYGIFLGSSSNNQITNCNVYNNSEYGIRLWYSSNNNIISNCAVYNNGYGILSLSSIKIQHTNIYQNTNDGIYLSSSNNIVEYGDVYSNGGSGIVLSSSTGSIIRNCDIYSNEGSGTTLSSSTIDNKIEDCNIRDNSYGLFLNNAAATISDNIIKENRGIGIYSTGTTATPSTVEITNNIISSNKNTAYACGIYAQNTNGVISGNKITGHITHPFIPMYGDGTWSDTGCGIYCKDAKIDIKDNEISGNVEGVVCVGTADAGETMIRNNNINANIGTSTTRFTVYVWNPKSGQMEEETITIRSVIGTGVSAEDSALSINDNSIVDNPGGIYLLGTSNAYITNNNIVFDKNVFEEYGSEYDIEVWGIITDEESTGSWTVNDVVDVRSTLIRKNIIYPMGIYIQGDLIVEVDGKITFQNTAYYVGCTETDRHGIKAEDGSELYVYDSMITAGNPIYHYTFKVFSGAKMEMKRTTDMEYHGFNTYIASCVEYCGYDDPGINNRGLYIASDDVVIESCTFLSNHFGIIFDGANLDIKDSKIENSVDKDIYLRGNARISTINTTFDESKVEFGDTPDEFSILSIYWYVDVTAYIPLESRFVDNVEIAVYDKNDFPSFATVTRTTVATRCTVRESKLTKNSPTLYTPHTILATYTDPSTGDVYDGVAPDIIIGESKIGDKAITIQLEDSRPNITITKPSVDNHLVSGTFLLQGTATDNVRVTNITFKIDDDGEWQPVACFYNWTFTNNSISWHYPLNTTAIDEGSHTIYVWAYDGVGWSNSVTINITVDNTAPTVTATIDPATPDGENGWYKSTPTITLETNESATIYYHWDANAYTQYTGMLTVPEGRHILSYYAVDTVGNRGTEGCIEVKVDTVAPIVSIYRSPKQPDGEDPWYKSAITITVTATDSNSGVNTIKYRFEGYPDWVEYTEPILYSTEDFHEIKVIATDYAGITSGPESTSFHIDRIKPNTTVTLDPESPNGENNWYTTDVTLTLSTSTDTSGIAFTKYRYYLTAWSSWVDYTTSIPFSDEGEYIVEYYSKDNAGNVEYIKSISFKIDKTPPTGWIIINECAEYTNVTNIVLNLSAIDSVSNVWQMNISSTVWDAFALTKTISVPSGDGTKTVSVKYRDYAGLESNTYYDTIVLDTTAPTNPTANFSSPEVNTWSNDNTVDVAWWCANDELSGIDGYYYLWDNNPTTMPTSDDNFTLSNCNTSLPLSDGVWYFHVRTIDKAGNLADDAYHVGPFLIDTTLPESNVLPIIPYWYNASTPSITVTANASNGGSGIKNVTLWYYSSTDNQTWSDPKEFGTNETPEKVAEMENNWTANWAFNFPEGDGWYRFYSIARDNASNEEIFTVNDTGCAYDSTPPGFTFKISRNPTHGVLNITVNATEILTNLVVNITNVTTGFVTTLTMETTDNVNWTGNYTVNGNGAYWINVTGWDKAGNIGMENASFNRNTWFHDIYDDFITGTTDNATITSDGNITLALNSTELTSNGNFTSNEAGWTNESSGTATIFTPYWSSTDGNDDPGCYAIRVQDNLATATYITHHWLNQTFTVTTLDGLGTVTAKVGYRVWVTTDGDAGSFSQLRLQLLKPDNTLLTLHDSGQLNNVQQNTFTVVSVDTTDNITLTGTYKFVLYYYRVTGNLNSAKNDHTVYWDDASVSLSHYYTEGNLTSVTLDAGQQVLWGRIWWNSTVPTDTNLSVQINASNGDGAWTGWLDCENGSWIPNITARNISYRVILNTTNTSITPVLHNITIEYFAPSTGPISIAVTGAALDDFSKLYITFSEIRIYDGVNWVTISTETKTVDILGLCLNDTYEIIGSSWVNAEKYTKIILRIENVTGVLKETGETIYIDISGKNVETAFTFNVVSGKHPIIIIHFDLTQCIESVGDKEYTFTPVVDKISEETYSFKTTIQPKEQSVKPGETATYTITINNTGTVDDTYSIEVVTSIDSSWINTPTSIFVSAGKSKQVIINIIPASNQSLMENTTYDFNIVVKNSLGLSQDNYASLTVIVTKESKTRYIIYETVELMETLDGMDIQQGVKNSLKTKLENALDKLNTALSDILNGDENHADNMLNTAKEDGLQAFINEVEAERGKKISEEDADTLTGMAQIIMDHINDAIVTSL